jgi:murein DD-endopeptidase MepM/ murein hydrolase activator NlpD
VTAAGAGGGAAMNAALAAIAAAVVGVTITSAVMSAGLQHELSKQDCASSPAQNLVSQELPAGSSHSGEARGGGGGPVADIPPGYLGLYRSAASEYGIDWAILAAVGYVESGHGKNMGSSSSGALGPMQFTPSTWDFVGYDANGDGKADVMDPEDAIPSAAKYLRDGGAPEDYHGALLQYNNSEQYVAEVLAKADEYRASGGDAGGGQLALIPALPTIESGAEGAVQGALALVLGLSLGVSPAYATVQGWDDVDEGLNLQYEDYSSYGGEVQHADDVWSALGTVNIEPSPGGSETDLKIGDGSLPPGVSGRTYSDGRMILDIKGSYPTTAVAHEFGHTLRLGHDTSQYGLMDMDPTTHPTAPSSYDKQVYYSIWGHGGGGSTGGTPVSNNAPASPGASEGSGEAVFPLPEENLGSFRNTWTQDEGTDFTASGGTPVSSVVGGRVVQHNGDERSLMIEADYSVGTVRKGDMLFYDGLGKKGVRIGDTVQAGQQIGSVAGGGGGLHLGWYDPSGQRAQSGSGAMDPFPLMNWLVQNGGRASGTAAEGPACESPATRASGTAPGAGGAPSGDAGGKAESGASGSAVVAEAQKYLGTPYLLGGPSACVPYKTMDCTCLTTTVFRKFGYELPDMPQSQLDYGEPTGSPEPGDLVVFPDPGDGTGGHVGIATGNGQMIHACMPCGEVTTGSISGAGTPNGYRRLVK